MRYKKLFILLAFFLFTIFGYSIYDKYEQIQDEERLIILNDSGSILIIIFLYFIFLLIIYKLIKKIQKNEEDYTRKLEVDIERKIYEINKQKEAFETLFEKSSDGILIMNDGKFIQCNEKVIKMLHYKSKNILLNKNPTAISPILQMDGQKSSVKAEEMMAIAKERGWHQFEWLYKRTDGDSFMAEVTMTSIVLNGHNVMHVILRDISDRKKVQKKLLEQKEILKHQAQHDTLTGLPNRLLFNDRLNHGIKHAKRHNKKLALLFIDLDNFKQINDTLGHQSGDKVLLIVTERLKSKLRAEDTIARLGGDEFTIIIENLKKLDNISVLCEKILNVIKLPIYIDNHTFYISCSIGISLYPEDDVDADNLVKYADAAMYKAKEEGRNNFQFYSSEMTVMVYKRVIMEANLRKALRKDEFIVHYQPQAYAKSGKLAGLEALIRWNDPKNGLIFPVDFIPLAEETGLIVDIDRYVMQKAMKQVGIWYKEGFNPGILALNLSMKQLDKDDFIAILKDCMRKNDFNPKWLELEISEGDVMKNPEKSIVKLKEISSMGIEIAIDDFGTGYSSLSYLKKLPVDTLKIDQSFVKGLPEDREDVSIVKAIIALANSFNLNIIAEGVETEDQKDFIEKNGCSYIQGYYYGKPMSALDIENRYLFKTLQ